MHKQRLLIVIGAGLGLISVFLPWVSIKFFGMNINAAGWQVWDGWVLFGLAVAAGVMALTQGDKTLELDADAKKKVMGIAGGAAGFMLFELFVRIGVGAAGIGAWLALIAALAMVAAPFIIKGDGSFEMPNKDTIKADIDGTNED